MVSSPKWIRDFNKVRALSPRERELLVRSVLLLPVIHIALLMLGYDRLRRVMERLAPLREPFISEVWSLRRAQEIARIVSIAAQHGLYQASCLRRSLYLWWLLRREGIQSKICFGVRLSGRKLEAHAWVELDGVVVNDLATVHERYRPLADSLPATILGL